MQDDDAVWLKEAAAKSTEAVSVRLCVLRQHHPALLREVERKEQQEAVVRAARRTHGAKAAALAKAATAKGQLTLTSMFRVVGKARGEGRERAAVAAVAAPSTPGGEGSGTSADDGAGIAAAVVVDLCTPDKEEHRSPTKKVKTGPRRERDGLASSGQASKTDIARRMTYENSIL